MFEVKHLFKIKKLADFTEVLYLDIEARLGGCCLSRTLVAHR